MAKTIYITRDIERALGMEPNDDYRIISNETPFSKAVRQIYPSYILLINGNKALDTGELMEDSRAIEYIKDASKGEQINILVFKNNQRIEKNAKENSWNLINPPYSLSEKIENKITQVEWLDELAKYLPSHKICKASEIKWQDKPLILQWSHGHTGNGTVLINSKSELEKIKEKFPERMARSSDYIQGPSFTMNIVVTEEKEIILSSPSYQITGLSPFTDNDFATIGNDWSIPHTILSEEENAYIEKIGLEIGAQMAESGWKGLFGIDLMKDESLNKIFLIEINARQPASTTYESSLQMTNRKNSLPGLTTFEAHISSLSGEEYNRTGKGSKSIIQLNDGAQIISRVPSNGLDKNFDKESIAKELMTRGYGVIIYENTDPGTDLIRIQSSRGIIEAHQKFNARGKEIVEILSNRK